MKIEKKVFVIVFRKSSDKLELLCLKPNPEPGRNTDYYVVTGSIDNGETKEEAVNREVFEEIGIQPISIINLNDKIKYTDHITKEKFIEYCYGAEINDDVQKLNEEHVRYKWVSDHDFVKSIWWDDDKAKLQKMVSKISGCN